jgi:hypothetical protein
MPLFDLGHSDSNGSSPLSLSGWTLGEVLVKRRKTAYRDVIYLMLGGRVQLLGIGIVIVAA